MSAPVAIAGQELLSEGERSGNERRWKVRLPDGRLAVLAQLLPELARDEALRRRYVRDAERLAALEVEGVAEILAIGPAPDPRDPDADPPWRLRADPPGETLEAWLASRAPAPIDETIDLGVRLCALLGPIHARGAVLRDLQPRQILVDGERLVLTDIGLARLDILSTRTASSLLLEGSPYAAPEHLRATRVDARADLYTVGVILWRALTATLPFGDGPALLRERTRVPPLSTVRAGVPAGMDALLDALLAERPEARPDCASDVAAALRGEPAAPRSLATIVCQSCGARLRGGLRLCLSCGNQAVQFHAASEAVDGWSLELTKVKEDASYLDQLRAILESVHEGPLPPLNFMTEHHGMYGKAERKTLLGLPVRLFDGLSAETAAELTRRMQARGLVVRKVSSRSRRRRTLGAVTALVGGAAATVAGFAVMVGPSIGVGLVAMAASGVWLVAHRKRGATLMALRKAPAALPAADPLIARLGALLAGPVAADVRGLITEIAVLVQRLADHRAETAGAAARELDAVVEPIEPLVGLLEKLAIEIATLDRELGDLDEATMVRALGASEARGEPRARRTPLLEGLDRLRVLEDQRARQVQRLLEVSALLRRAVSTGLRVADPEAAGRAELELARAALEDD